jgi:hypothetical protein
MIVGDRRKHKATTILYVLRIVGTDFYKIGITNNLTNRLSAIRCEYPRRNIEDIAFVYCANRQQALSYELNLHGILKHKRAQFEWFSFTHNEIVCLLDFMDTFLDSQVHRDEDYKRFKSEIFVPTLDNRPYHF